MSSPPSVPTPSIDETADAAVFFADMQGFLDDLRAFDFECSAEGRTDSGAFWEIVEPHINRWRPRADPQTCSHPNVEVDPELEVCTACGERMFS